MHSAQAPTSESRYGGRSLRVVDHGPAGRTAGSGGPQARCARHLRVVQAKRLTGPQDQALATGITRTRESSHSGRKRQERTSSENQHGSSSASEPSRSAEPDPIE